MTRAESVQKYNKTLWKAGLVQQLVENSDENLLIKFCEDIKTDEKDMLDIGCATGAIASILATRCPGWKSYLGIDLTIEYVEAFNGRQLPAARAEIGDATCLMIESSSKDIILCLFVLQHLSKDEGRQVLREIKRVARPSADVLIALTVNPGEVENEKLYAAKAAIQAGTDEILTSIWNRREFEDAISEVGLLRLDAVDIPGRAPYVKLYVRART